MQWYVYLITIPAVAFLGQVSVELIGRPIRMALRLRRHALERLLAFQNISLPRPRELAISSREIFEYDQAVRKVREAQRTFAYLGARLLAFSESEPAIRNLMALFGLDTILAGYELVNLAELYSTAKTDSERLQRSIGEAHNAAMTAFAVSRRLSGDDLIRIKLEPMRLRDGRNRKRQLSRTHVTSRHASPRWPVSDPAKDSQNRRYKKEAAYR